MTHAYRAVGWNRGKRLYDLVLAGGVALYLAAFAAWHLALHPDVTAETILIRGFGSAALILLHVVLCIGPLCRLDRRWLPLLYNRRHMGVTLFVLALLHGALATFQFHALGDQPALLSLLTGNGRTDALAPFPFELLGVGGLLILFVMAATSHDFWLSQLTPPVWKALHMLVYAAYGLLVMHVALGALQDARAPAAPLPLVTGLVVVLGLHLGAGWKERRGDREAARRAPRGGEACAGAEAGRDWADVAAVEEIEPDRAVTACVGGERVAVFRHAGGLSAVSSVCRHQGGPLGEGRVIDGCITCPWHGYQYLPESGRSPPPFDERVPTFAVRVADGRVLVDPRPRPAGTPLPPAPLPASVSRGDEAPSDDEDDPAFFIGWRPRLPRPLVRPVRRAVAGLLLLALLLAATRALVSEPFAPAVFEFGRSSRFEGTLREHPAPRLEVPRPGRGAGTGSGEPGASSWLLVAEGKWGAAERVAGLDGRTVAVTGTLVHRQGHTVLELAPDGVAPLDAGAGPPAPAVEDLGHVALSGEIVDSKCWTGVMNPGEGKVHRACAIRCLSGGIPALFAVPGQDGAPPLAPLLVDVDGGAVNHRVLDMVGEPLTITGRLTRQGDQLVLSADPSAYAPAR